MLSCLSYVYWKKIEPINNCSKWLWAKSHGRIYLMIKVGGTWGVGGMQNKHVFNHCQDETK